MSETPLQEEQTGPLPKLPLSNKAEIEEAESVSGQVNTLRKSLKHFKIWLAVLSVAFVLVLVYAFLLTRKSTGHSSLQAVIGFPVRASAITLPDTLSFAGEKVPLTDEDVMERLDKEMVQNVYYQSNTLLVMKRANRWFPKMEAILKQYNIPSDFKYVPAIESSLENKVSPRGASGYWQIMEPAGKEFGLEITAEVDERYHPLKATHAACKYFLRVQKFFGSWTAALGSYNVGMGSLYKSIKAQKMKSYYDLYLNTETSRYVFRLLALKQIMENPGQYGYEIKESALYKPNELKEIRIDQSIPDLAEWALKQGANYKILKLYNPWLRKNTLTISEEGKYYIVDLPEKTIAPDQYEREIKLGDTLIEQEDTSGLAAAPAQAAPRGETEEDPNALNLEGETANKNRPAMGKEKADEKTQSKEVPETYIVKRGETLSHIALRYGIAERTLVKINKLSSLRVQAGQKLKLKE